MSEVVKSVKGKVKASTRRNKQIFMNLLVREAFRKLRFEAIRFQLQDGWIFVGIMPAQKCLLFWSSF